MPRATLDGADPRVEAAVAALHDRIEREPGAAAPLGELGMFYEAHGVHRAALRCYELASSLDPAEPRWPYLEALQHARRGALAAALAAMDRSLAIDPEHAPAQLHRATWLLDMNRLDESLDAFGRAAVASDEPAAVVGEARALLRLDRVDEAITSLESLVASRPGDPYPRQQLAVALRRAGRTERANEVLADARGVRPPRWRDPRRDAVSALKTGFGAEMAIAEDLLAAGRAAEAIELLERLRVERPADRPLLNNLSVAYRQAGRADEAFAVLEDGLARHPDYFAFHLNIAPDHARRGDLDRALHHLERAAELNPTLARPHLLRGQLLTRARRLDDALAAFESALRFEPREPTALFYGGVLALELGRAARAIALLERALEVAPDNVAASIGLARALIREGDPQRAAALLDDVEARRPGHPQLAAARAELERGRAGEGR